jgi:hypothetical protein
MVPFGWPFQRDEPIALSKASNRADGGRTKPKGFPQAFRKVKGGEEKTKGEGFFYTLSTLLEASRKAARSIYSSFKIWYLVVEYQLNCNRNGNDRRVVRDKPAIKNKKIVTPWPLATGRDGGQQLR